jgi:ariadne-1
MIFLKLEDIRSIINTKIDELKELIGEEYDTTLILFHYFKWSKDKLENSDWFVDQDTIKVKAGLKPTCKVTSETNSGLCSVCFAEDDPKELECLECGHKICNSCWLGYINDKVILYD